MRVALTFAMFLLLASCATSPQGRGVSEWFAGTWRCDYSEVMERAEEIKETFGPKYVTTPRVGWTACELMARNGAPDEVDRQQSESGRYASWWYSKGEYGVRLVRLDLEDGDWIVSYVDW